MTTTTTTIPMGCRRWKERLRTRIPAAARTNIGQLPVVQTVRHDAIPFSGFGLAVAVFVAAIVATANTAAVTLAAR